MTISLKNDAWKILSVIMSTLIIPLAGWVWNTNVKITEIQNDLSDVESDIAKIETTLKNSEVNTRQIISIEKDVEYMKQTLDRIENLVTSGRP